jgi:hypothetical protein
MATNPNSRGRRKEQRQRGIPPDTMITTDNYQLILTQDSLLAIANLVSARTKHKFNANSISTLAKFIARLPESRFYQMSYSETQKAIANDFITRHAVALGMVEEQDVDTVLSGVAEDTDRGGIQDYNRKELAQLTPNENAFKFTAHAERRGNAVIDRERVEGKRSSPDNILPVNDAAKTQSLVNRELYSGMKLLKKFLSPESTEEMFSRIQSTNTNYYNINLVHQLIQFDSRNRLPVTFGSDEYKWNIHTSGQPGQMGDIRIQDTLQQVIQIKAYPFWIPVNATTMNPYNKVRLLLKELSSQSITAYEFNDPSLSVPVVENYHFEFEVKSRQGDRLYLVPKEDTFSFRKPFARVETITTQFRTPFNEDVFDPDFGVYTITYGNPTLLTLTNYSNNFLNTGDLIYIYNSSSANTAIDDELNSAYGYYITKLSATQFTIPVDSSALSGTQTGVNVAYGSKRVFFQIEFLCLEQ